MLSVDDVFYSKIDEPVLVVPPRRGYLSRQDSRNFRSSASPPPSRYNHHASAWYGHRKSSQSPPRYRQHGQPSEYTEYSDYRGGGRYSRSPERSSYHDHNGHTKFKEEYTGYAQNGGHDRGHATGYGRQGEYYDPRSSSGYDRHRYPESRSYATGAHSSSGYHGHGETHSYHGGYSSSPHMHDHVGEYPGVVELKVPMCCEACEERITNHMLSMDGVDSVTCDQERKKVTVRGTASPSDILKQGKECFRQTKFWRH